MGQNTEIKITDGELSYEVNLSNIKEVIISSIDKKHITIDNKNGSQIKLPHNINVVKQCIEHGII